MTPTPSNPDPGAALPEVDLLPICPVCGYSLTGLPIQHRCPECGFEFDRRWQVHGGRYISSTARAHSRTIGIGFAMLWVCEFAVLALLPGVPRWFPLLLVPGTTIPVLFYLFLFVRPRRQFVVISATDLRLYIHGKERMRIPWREVESATHNLRGKEIVVVGRSGKRRLCGSGPFGIHFVDLERCIHAINRYPRPPAGDPGDPPALSSSVPP